MIMKKTILIFSMVLLFSCQKRGHIFQAPQDFIQINGKVYKLIQIVPCDGCDPIWIMYPKDSLNQMPTILNYTVNKGKTSNNESIIKID